MYILLCCCCCSSLRSALIKAAAQFIMHTRHAPQSTRVRARARAPLGVRAAWPSRRVSALDTRLFTLFSTSPLGTLAHVRARNLWLGRKRAAKWLSSSAGGARVSRRERGRANERTLSPNNQSELSSHACVIATRSAQHSLFICCVCCVVTSAPRKQRHKQVCIAS